MGDNKSWWSHILLNLKMLPSLNMCGFLYTGADLGGFGADTTRDLVLRWLALGVFTPPYEKPLQLWEPENRKLTSLKISKTSAM